MQTMLFHRQILQQQGEANTEVVPDRSLPSIVKEVERKIADFEHEPQHLVTDEGFLAWNACILSLQLAKTLQNDEAVLLPELYATFCKNIAQTIDKYESVARAIKTTPPTIRWLLSFLSYQLGTLLALYASTDGIPYTGFRLDTPEALFTQSQPIPKKSSTDSGLI